MDLDKLNFLPPWDDDHHHDGDEWKTAEGKKAGKALYLKWGEIYALVNGFIDALSSSHEAELVEGMAGSIQSLMRENSLIISAKLHSTAGVSVYILKMEGAAIIRKNARELLEQAQFAHHAGLMGKEYVDAISGEMDAFRSLFKAWVATFEKDDIEDEWGLF